MNMNDQDDKIEKIYMDALEEINSNPNYTVRIEKTRDDLLQAHHEALHDLFRMLDVIEKIAEAEIEYTEEERIQAIYELVGQRFDLLEDGGFEVTQFEEVADEQIH